MYYSSGCNCGCDYDCGCNTVPSTCCTTCSPIITTTTIPCIGEPCDELYNCECVTYSGPDLTCYGIINGTSLCDIIEIIATHLPNCVSTDICFTISENSLPSTSCVTQPSLLLWNGKVYYQPKIGNCSTTLGYVYWTGSQWEYANGLGGGTQIYAYLPIPSEYPITSPSGPWINFGTTVIMESSTEGVCPVITTTTTSYPCPCSCITFNNVGADPVVVTWLSCGTLIFNSYTVPGLSTHQVCGTNSTGASQKLLITIGDSCVPSQGDCVCNVPTTTTTSAPTTTTTTIAPCKCYTIIYPTSILSPVKSFSYRTCTGILVGGSIVVNTSVNICAQEGSVTASGLLLFDNGLCTNGCTSTTTTIAPTTIAPSTSTTTSTTTTTTVAPTTTTTILPIVCNCILFSNISDVSQSISYRNCSGVIVSTSIPANNQVQYCGSNAAASNPASVIIITGGACIDGACLSPLTTSTTTTTTTIAPPADNYYFARAYVCSDDDTSCNYAFDTYVKMSGAGVIGKFYREPGPVLQLWSYKLVNTTLITTGTYLTNIPFDTCALACTG